MVQTDTAKLLLRATSVVVVLFVLGAAVTFVNSVVHAANGASNFSNRLTNINDVIAGGTQGAIDLHLKNVEDIAVVKENVVAAYYPGNVLKSNNSMKLRIMDGLKGRVCNISPKAKAGNVEITIQNDENKTTKTVNIKDVCNTNKFFGITVPFPNGKLIHDDGTGLKRADVTVRFTGPSSTQEELGGSDMYSLNYNLRLEGSNSSNAKLALRREATVKQFGLRSSFEDNPSKASNRQVKAGIVFGFPCTVEPDKLGADKRRVKIYDADSVFGDTFVWVEKNGRKLDDGDYSRSENEKVARWDEGRKAWELADSNRYHNSVALKPSAISGNSEYKMMILNTGKVESQGNKDSVVNPHYNTLSLTTPYDSIYGTPKCNYNLKPTVNPPENSSRTVPVGATISAASVVGNIEVDGGYDADSHAWMLTARAYETMPNVGSITTTEQAACVWRTGTTGPPCKFMALGTKAKGFGTSTFSHAMDTGYSTAGLEAGNVVCFMMSVKKPTYNAPATKWRHSSMKCIGIGGASEGTTVTPDTYSYYPSLTATTVIRNDANYPKVDVFMGYEFKRNKYTWKQIEAKYSKRPTASIGTVDKGGCQPVIDKGGSSLLVGSCTPIVEGNNLFPEPGDPDPIVHKSKQVGPDPIGTWTCYTFGYRTNPAPSQQLENKIREYIRDWNDPNQDSSDPHWSDGRWQVDVPDYDEDGKYIGSHKEWRGGDAARFNEVFDPYDKASPYHDPPKFKFTPFKPASCSQSGIDPKVQIRGNDLKVGGDINTYLRTMGVGNAIGSYGSSAEYGVLSGGVNSNTASGSGLLRGSTSPDQASWSTLTFTNNDPSAFGNFDGVPASNEPVLTGATSYPDGTRLSTLTYSKGDRIVIDVDGTLIIDGDLKYPNAYSRISEIPRVVIRADNIQIEPGVKRIDPWLIATNISTCGPPRGFEWDENVSSGAALGEANLKTGECYKPLIFNGPVYASNIYLYRTGGSRVFKNDLNDNWKNPDSSIDPKVYCENGNCGSGASGRKYALSAPAEVFNLRPDAFLTSFSGTNTGNPVAMTDKVTELPPRF